MKNKAAAGEISPSQSTKTKKVKLIQLPQLGSLVINYANSVKFNEEKIAQMLLILSLESQSHLLQQKPNNAAGDSQPDP